MVLRSFKKNHTEKVHKSPNKPKLNNFNATFYSITPSTPMLAVVAFFLYPPSFFEKNWSNHMIYV